jgi:hypothetical protein
MTAAEAQSAVYSALKSGLCHAAQPQAKIYSQCLSEAQRTRHNNRNLDRYYDKRDAFISQGLTSQGKKRTREPRHNLKNMSPEQKKARALEQARVWHSKHKT